MYATYNIRIDYEKGGEGIGPGKEKAHCWDSRKSETTRQRELAAYEEWFWVT